MHPVAMEEGRVEVPGGSIWYRMVGGGDGVPLVTLHGGPGYPSISLESLDELAEDRPVVFYDQLGCGNSDRPDDESLWTVERFVEELEAVLDHLELDDVHLFGHSWGTLLAVEFYLAHPQRVWSMVLLGPMLSTVRWTADCERLISGLPADLQEIHSNPEADEEEIERLDTEFKKRHIFRLDDEPESRKKAREGFGKQVYNTIWGPNEFTATGTLVGYDRTGDLGRINVPVLYLCGRHDEATPESTGFYASLTPQAKVHVFEDSSHTAFLEQPDEFFDVVRRFLTSS